MASSNNSITVTDQSIGPEHATFLLAAKHYPVGMIAKDDGTIIGNATDPIRTDPTGTTTQPVSAASLPLPTGAATSALQTQPGVDIGDVTVNNAAGASAVNVQDGGNTLTIDTLQLPTTIGTKTAAASVSVTQASDEVVPLGQAAMAASMPVVLASNQTNVPTNTVQLGGVAINLNTGSVGTGTQRVVEAGSATGTATNVASSATSVTLLAANTARRGATIFNDSTQILYAKLGATASTSSFAVKIQPDGYYEVPGFYNGIVDGIWASANGNARVTEIS